MNSQHELNIIKFLSIIFNANNYPMPEVKIKCIAKGIFKDDLYVDKILKEFVWSDKRYYLNPLDILSVHKVSQSIYKTLSNWNKSGYVWSLCTLYNSTDDKTLFYNLLKKNCTLKRKAILSQYIKQEVTTVKENKYSEEGYGETELKKFIDYHHLLNYFRPYAYNSCLSRLFSINKELNCIPWSEIIETLPHNFLKFLCNFSYHFYKMPVNYYLKQINSKSSDALISLAILNTISIINRYKDKNKIRKGFMQIFIAIQKLQNEKMFYWYGIILSNMEYCIARIGDTPQIFETVSKKELFALLNNNPVNNKNLRALENGLDTTSRHCYFKYFIIFQKFAKTNKKLAIRLAQEILTNYTNKIKSKQTHDLSFFSKHENDYCNTVISALLYLTMENKFDIYKFLKKLFSYIFVDIEDFEFTYSNLLDKKDKTLHLFIVALFTLECLKTKKIAINEKYMNNLVHQYFHYINYFYHHFDQQEWLSLSNILNLKTVKKCNYIDEEIEQLYNYANPNFEILAFLLGKRPKNRYYQLIFSFIENYFNKYHQYWDIHEFEKWFKIWYWLENQTNIKVCILKMPEWKQKEYIKTYDLQLNL